MSIMGSTVIVLSPSEEAAEELLAVIQAAIADYVELKPLAAGKAMVVAGRDRYMARAETAPEVWGQEPRRRQPRDV